MGNRPAGVKGRFDVSKALFYSLLACALLGGAFGLGLRAGVQRNAAYRVATSLSTTIEQSLSVTAGELSTLFRIEPTHFLQASRYWGDGVTVNDPTNDQSDLILLSGFFTDTNELRLIRRSGEVIARWPVRFSELFPNTDHFPAGWEPATDWNIDTHGAVALPDGSVVFNFEWGGLVKLDRCGSAVWTVRRQTHHSVERAEGGGFWVPGRRVVTGESPFPPFETPFQEDTILKVSEDGRVLIEVSVPGILYKNGLEAVLTATGSTFTPGMPWDQELVHLNKIDELTGELAGDFPMFEAGDLALSIRELNLVLVVDKAAEQVKWWRIGPWLRQHDPQFRRGGTILVFNNNIYETVFGPGDQQTPVTTPRVSNIVEIDPASGESSVIYGGKRGQELLTVVRGKVDATPRQGLLIVETEGGRVLETGTDGRILWQYVNRYSPDAIAEITSARLYPSSYFDVKDWSCAAT